MKTVKIESGIELLINWIDYLHNSSLHQRILGLLRLPPG